MSIPYEGQKPAVADTTMAIAVYALYAASYITGISGLIGIIIAHVKADDPDPVLRSHFQFQIRTFWIGLLYVVIGTPLCMVLVGIPILIWWFVWSLIRIIKGFVLILDEKPIANPKSWLFG